MSEVLGLEHLGIVPDGPTLSLSVSSGQALTVTGPGASGKSRLLRILAGLERPAQGAVRTYGRVAFVESGGLPRRARVQNLARKGGGLVNNAARATDILLATNLWDARHETIADLSPAQIAACELIDPLTAGAEVVILDGQLDRLDPWSLKSVSAHIATLRSQGVAFVISTNRPDLVGAFDAVVVLNQNRIRFAGTIEDLLRAGPPHTLQVSTENAPGVRALVSPFEVTVRKDGDHVQIEAAEGQSLAARLLLEGYGDVKFVVLHQPTVQEALLSLF